MAIQMAPPTPEHGDTGLVVAPGASLPSIADMRNRMQWMIEMRPLLREYIQTQMDPARHMYSFENNRYTPLTVEALKAMMTEGKKPALNQDGIHNLMSLFGCYPDEPAIYEVREAGFYTCRATVRLISFSTGQPMGAGTGSCSTRESKYAYRWVYNSDIPKGTDKTTLKQREFEGRNGSTYVRYRLENEDVADVEATVLQMAVKRAKSAAVKALPLVSEMFAEVGDPEEERRQEDARRQELLAPLRDWLKSMPAKVRAKAVVAVFGEPLRSEDVPKLDEDRLAVAAQVVEIATAAKLDWAQAVLPDDLKHVLQTHAQKATSDLFGDAEAVKTAQAAARHGQTTQVKGEMVNTTTGKVVSDREPGEEDEDDPRQQSLLGEDDRSAHLAADRALAPEE